jgi:type II restriction/modification system DNA methylase subunit YeeA
LDRKEKKMLTRDELSHLKNTAQNMIREYEMSLDVDKKKKGAHYTQPEIAGRVVKKTLDMLFENTGKRGFDNILKTRICDPACGGGTFLIEAFDYLVGVLKGSADDRIGCVVDLPYQGLTGVIVDTESSGQKVKVRIDGYTNEYATDYQHLAEPFDPYEEWFSGWDTIGKRIGVSDRFEKIDIEIDDDLIRKLALNCLYGFDIDPHAVETTKKALGAITGLDPSEFDQNIICGDFLFDDRVIWYDAFIGNPPFIGGSKISGLLGKEYLKKLKKHFESANGRADYCAYFFRRASYLLKEDGAIGFIATNTISQGATHRAGLMQLVQEDGLIIFEAEKNWKWPGKANVTVSTVYLTDDFIEAAMRR